MSASLHAWFLSQPGTSQQLWDEDAEFLAWLDSNQAAFEGLVNAHLGFVVRHVSNCTRKYLMPNAYLVFNKRYPSIFHRAVPFSFLSPQLSPENK